MKIFAPIACVNIECTNTAVLTSETDSELFDISYEDFHRRIYCNNCWAKLMRD